MLFPQQRWPEEQTQDRWINHKQLERNRKHHRHLRNSWKRGSIHSLCSLSTFAIMLSTMSHSFFKHKKKKSRILSGNIFENEKNKTKHKILEKKIRQWYEDFFYLFTWIFYMFWLLGSLSRVSLAFSRYFSVHFLLAGEYSGLREHKWLPKKNRCTNTWVWKEGIFGESQTHYITASLSCASFVCFCMYFLVNVGSFFGTCPAKTSCSY